MADKNPIDYLGGPVGAVSSHGEAGIGEVLKPAASPNKAELRRVAEAAMAGDWFKAGDLLCFDIKSGESHGLNVEDDRFIAAANPAAVLSLLNSEAQAKCEAGHAIQQKDAAYAECKALRAERDAALAELESCRKDAERLNLLADHVVIEGFVGVEKDIYDLSCGVAEGNGREEPSEDDQRQAFRLLIDAFRAKESPNA